MSYIDDVYADLIIERNAYKEAFETRIIEISNKQIVYDAIALFRKTAPLKGNIEKAKDILKTISRLKRVSDKQKRFLYSFLMQNDDSYRKKHSDMFVKFLERL